MTLQYRLRVKDPFTGKYRLITGWKSQGIEMQLTRVAKHPDLIGSASSIEFRWIDGEREQ